MRNVSWEFTADQVEAALKHNGVAYRRSDLFRNSIEVGKYSVVGLTIGGRVWTSNTIAPMVSEYVKQQWLEQ